ncbi:MAG: 50S ribosomal protein L9 [Gemmatimonadota bacterium]
MKLILKENVENLGQQGEVVDVKPGFARNYLLPQRLAYEASDANIQRLEEEQKRAQEREKRDYLEGRRRASQIEGLTLTFSARAGEGDDAKLFGSITNADITDRLNEGKFDFEVDRRQVVLEEPIKHLGSFQVPVRLHGEVTVEVEVVVTREDA